MKETMSDITNTVYTIVKDAADEVSKHMKSNNESTLETIVDYVSSTVAAAVDRVIEYAGGDASVFTNVLGKFASENNVLGFDIANAALMMATGIVKRFVPTVTSDETSILHEASERELRIALWFGESQNVSLVCEMGTVILV